VIRLRNRTLGIALSQWSNPFAAGIKDNSQLQAGRESTERVKPPAQKRSANDRTSRRRQSVQQLREHATASAFTRLSRCDGSSRVEIFRRSGGADFYALALAAAERADRQKLTPRGSRQARSWRSYSGKNRTIPGWRITSFTPTTCRLWRERRLSPRGVTPISRLTPTCAGICRHTRSRVWGYWQDLSTATALPAAASRRVGQTAEELHASDLPVSPICRWRRTKAARKVLEALPEIASRFDPRMVVSGAAGPDAGYFALAAIPARYAVERHDWHRAAELQPSETPFPYTDALTCLRGHSSGPAA